MVCYEINLILRRMTRGDTIAAMKRHGALILERRGILRKIEYMGTKNLPYTFEDPKDKDAPRITMGSYFILHAEVPPLHRHEVREGLQVDDSTVRVVFMEKDRPKIPSDYVCTLEEELLPPALRPSVQQLIEMGRKIKQPQIPPEPIDNKYFDHDVSGPPKYKIAEKLMRRNMGGKKQQRQRGERTYPDPKVLERLHGTKL